MAINKFAFAQSDVENFIADKTLELAQKQLILHQLGERITMPKGRGLTYTFTRFPRLALPQYPLAEAVSSNGQEMTLQQVSSTVQQWGDSVTITDIAEIGVKHPLVKEAEKLMGLQIAETLERNTANTLMSGTQVAFVGSVGSRGALTAASFLNLHECNRVVTLLRNLGVPQLDGDDRTDQKVDAEEVGKRAANNKIMAHYAAIAHPFVAQDLSEDSTAVQLWSFSDKNKIYMNELGDLRGLRFCVSNMIPSFTGVAQFAGTAGTAGGLATGTYYIVVTQSDTQNQYESIIAQVSAGIAVTGPSGSISVVLPAAPGYTYNVYIGTTTSPVNLATSPQGPLSGIMLGQATQLTPGQTVTLTGVGTAQVPPAAPATGRTVYPTFILGKGAFAHIELDAVKIELLTKADKSDKHNQKRLITWKVLYSSVIKNQQFLARIESVASNAGTFS